MSQLDKYKLYDFTPDNYDGKTHPHIMQCYQCGRVSIMIVSEQDYMTWQTKLYVQDAFPYLSAEKREMIINGMHPECFDKLFPE
jgi:hypothetical protein